MTKTQPATPPTGPANERTIVIARTFDAPRTTVFEAWTTPKHLAQWWDPSGAPLAICEMDVRPNGAFRWVNRGGDIHPFTGHYVEIAPASRLVFTTPAPSGGLSIGELVFEEHAGKTTLTMTMTFPSKADHALMLKIGVDVGTRQTLDNLSKFLNNPKRTRA